MRSSVAGLDGPAALLLGVVGLVGAGYGLRLVTPRAGNDGSVGQVVGATHGRAAGVRTVVGVGAFLGHAWSATRCAARKRAAERRSSADRRCDETSGSGGPPTAAGSG